LGLLEAEDSSGSDDNDKEKEEKETSEKLIVPSLNTVSIGDYEM
jgi:hypothetical protein